MDAARHGIAVPRGQVPRPPSSGARFGRMFPHLPVRDPGDCAIDALVELLAQVAAPDDGGSNPLVLAGYTYLGQFVDHDITFDPTSQLQRDNDPEALVNFRTARFDLDSLYGSGPADQPYLYDWDCGPPAGVKLLVGSNPPGFERQDLPRNNQDRALIGDARNDENLIVSQLHLLFIGFHNKVVDRVCADNPRLDDTQLLEEAQRIVRWHYQWIVVHDLLEKIVGETMARDVLRPAAKGRPPTAAPRFYDGRHRPAIPVEFSGAAFRFGHSMVRQSYQLNPKVRGSLFPKPEEAFHMGGFRRLPDKHRIDWGRFFVLNHRVKMRSMAIDHHITSQLFSLPDGRALPELNLRRGRALGLPAGRDVARAMGVTPLDEEELFPPQLPSGVLTADDRAALLDATPLWYYVLREAASRCRGRHLGRVGGRIVAEVLVGLLEADPNSYLNQWPEWEPHLGDEHGVFTMVDLVKFTQGSISTTSPAAPVA